MKRIIIIIPEPHSCAICKNRPIDFIKIGYQRNGFRNPEDLCRYPQMTVQEEREEYHRITRIKDSNEQEKEWEKLKIYRKCPTSHWTRTAPFKTNHSECFDSDKDAGYFIHKWESEGKYNRILKKEWKGQCL